MGIACIILGFLAAGYGGFIAHGPTSSTFYRTWWLIAGALIVPGALACVGGDALPSTIALILQAIMAVELLILAAFAGIALRIMTASREPAPPGLAWLIVLGAQVHPNGAPSLALRYRLEAAVAYLQANHATRVVTSGGQGSNEPCTEAAAMARWLIEHGIAPERVVEEGTSTTTAENLVRSRQLIGDTAGGIGIVTNDFHLYRALRIARRLNVGPAWGISAYSQPRYLPHNLLRECFAIIKNRLRGMM